MQSDIYGLQGAVRYAISALLYKRDSRGARSHTGRFGGAIDRLSHGPQFLPFASLSARDGGYCEMNSG